MVGRTWAARAFPVLALLTACAIIPLVSVGAGVTSKDAGMAYPDWPTSDGHLLNPPGWLQGEKTRWEHGHRLIGWVVGLLATSTALIGMFRGGAGRVLAWMTFLAVGVQGLLGGLRVTEVSTALAMVHGVWGQVCFCLAATTVLVGSSAWVEQRTRIEVRSARFLQRLCLGGTALAFLQLVVGAGFRHFAWNAALAAHLLGAVVVSFVIGWMSLWVMGQFPGRRLFVIPAKALAVLMVVQLLLGGNALLVVMVPASWPGVLQWLVPTLHVAVGAMLLACSTLLTICVCRFLRPTPAARLSDVVNGMVLPT